MEVHVDAGQVVNLYEEWGPAHYMAARVLSELGVYLVYENHPSLLRCTVSIYCRDSLYDVGDYDFMEMVDLRYVRDIEERLHRLVRIWLPDFPFVAFEQEKADHAARKVPSND